MGGESFACLYQDMKDLKEYVSLRGYKFSSFTRGDGWNWIKIFKGDKNTPTKIYLYVISAYENGRFRLYFNNSEFEKDHID